MRPGQGRLARVAHVEHHPVEAVGAQLGQVVGRGRDVFLGDQTALGRAREARRDQAAVGEQPDRKMALGEPQAGGQAVPDTLAGRLRQGVDQHRRQAALDAGAAPRREGLRRRADRVERQGQRADQGLGLGDPAAGQQQVAGRRPDAQVFRHMRQHMQVDLDGAVHVGLGLDVVALLVGDRRQHGQRLGVVRDLQQDPAVVFPRAVEVAGRLEPPPGLERPGRVERRIRHRAVPPHRGARLAPRRPFF